MPPRRRSHSWRPPRRAPGCSIDGTHPSGWPRLATGLLRTGIAAAVAGAAGAAVVRLGGRLLDDTGWDALIHVAVAGAVITVVYVGVLQVIRAPEREVVRDAARLLWPARRQ